jgi:hypothetical protein
MTLEEARKLATIADTVDGGCEYCVMSVVRQLNEEFPDFEWRYNKDDYRTVVIEL